jgi:phosphate transport system permease protein
MKRWKLVEEKIIHFISGFATYSIIAVMLLIIGIIFYKGMSGLNWELISQAPKGGFYYGGDGGVLNAIVGSLYIAGGATLIAILLGLPAALYMNVYLIKRKKTLSYIRYFLDVLWGIPSIVYGVFGFLVMIYIEMSASMLVGIITVGLLITPILIRTFDEVLSTIPLRMHESALSLGSTNTELAYKVLFKQGFSGFITAVLLSFGRGIGDAASVLFTAGYSDNVPFNLDEPCATLPLAIFFQLGSPIPEVRDRAFASAALLTIIILIISLSARFISRKVKSNNQK